MKSALLNIFAISVLTITSHGQADYNAQLKKFQTDYVSQHEVVKENDKNYFRFSKSIVNIQ